MSAAPTSQRFAYRAMGAGGSASAGEIDAGSVRQAREELQRRGLLVIEVKPAGASGRGASRGSRAERPARAGASAGGGGGKPANAQGAWRRVRAEVFAELALLLESGMALDAALETVSGLARKPEHRSALDGLTAQVREGRTLAEGLRGAPGFFLPVHAAMAQVGEETGRLPEVLRRLNEQEERSARLRQQLVSTMTYPVILVSVGGLILAGIVSFVVPKFSAIFEEVGVRIPLFSRVVIAVCEFARDWLPALLVGLLVGLAAGRAALRSAERRRAAERWLLERTLVGRLWWKHQAAGFAGAMAMMLRSGTPILRALEIGRTTWSAAELRARLDAVVGMMREGGRFSDAARRCGLLPERSDALLAVGEDGGNLPTVFERLATSLEHEVSDKSKRALTLLEPLAILAIGSVVGAVVIAMLLAIFSINDLQVVG